MGIRINIEWKGKKGFDNLIRYIENNSLYFEAQSEIVDLGEQTAESMRTVISNEKKRHSFGNNLESNINSEILNETAGVEVGIGRISQLKANAPYFEVLDKGGYVPYSTVKGAPLGSFEGDKPSGSASPVQNWERSGDKGFFMKPKKAIEGIDYIGKAIRALDRQLRIVMENLGAKFADGAAKAATGKVNIGGSTYVKAWGKKVRFFRKGGVDMG